MSSKSVKFEISLEKLTVKFEGDIQIAERVQGEITGALNTLASAQQRMLSAAPNTASAAPADVISSGRRPRRRRRSSAATSGIDSTVLDGLNGSNGSGADEVDGDSGRRASRGGGGPNTLIQELKSGGFFATKRTIGAIREALAAKGHTLKSNQISPTLVSLTRDNVLKREKNPQKQWIYFAD